MERDDLDERGGTNGKAAELTADLSSRTILVIDDEPPVVNFVSDYFSARGATVITALDGEAGLEAFREHAPDLVLSDLLLPKCNGFSLVEELEASAPHTPVVVMSGIYKGERYKEELAHARLFFDKPLGIEALNEAARLLADAPCPDGAPVTGLNERSRARSKEPWIPTSLLPLPKVLSLLWKDQRSGLLSHRSGDCQTVFTISEGQVRFVRCNDPELALGRLLTGVGKASTEQVERATEELKSLSEPTRLGSVLLRQRVLTEDDLKKVIRLQLRKIISATFSRNDGETLFSTDAGENEEDIVVEADMPTLLVAGCAVMDDESPYLLGHLPDADTLLEMNPRAQGLAAKLPPTERGLLATIIEPTRQADIASMARLVGLRPRRLIFGLLCAQVLQIAATERGEWVNHEPLAVGESEDLDVSLAPPATLLRLSNELATGVLTVTRGDKTSWLWMKNGALRGAGSNDGRDRLGQLLQESGLVSGEQLSEALAAHGKNPRKTLGRILVDSSALDPAHLLHAVQGQLLTIARDVASIPAWDRATFDDGRFPKEEPVDLKVSTHDVVLEALRDTSWKGLVALVGRLAPERPLLDLDILPRRFSLSEAERLVVDAVSSKTEDFMHAIDEGESDPDVLRVLAAALLVAPTLVSVEE